MAKKVAIEIDIQGTKDVIELQKQIREVNKELKTTEDAEAFDKLAKDLVGLKAQLKEARKAQRQAVDAFAATDEGIGAYSRLSAELRVARNRLKDLAAAGTTTGAEVEELTETVNRLDSTLKDIDRSVGQTNREIGQYEEAVRKAVGITDAQTGAFTRLKGRADILRRTYRDLVAAQGANSEEARKLKKELDRVEKQLKATGNQAEKTGKRIGGLRTQLRQLGPAFTGLASGFIAFTELPQVLSDVTEGLRAVGAFLSPTIALSQRLSSATLEASETFVEEKLALEGAFGALKNTAEGTDERKQKIQEINEEYGPYLENLLDEAATNEQVEIAQRAATSALLDDIAAQQTRKEVTRILEGFTEATANSTNAQKLANETTGQAANFLGQLGQSLVGLGSNYVDITDVQQAYFDSQAEGFVQQAKGITDFQNDLRGNLGRINDAFEEANFDLSTFQQQANERSAQLQQEAQERREAAAKKAADREAKRIAAQAKREREQRLKEQQKTLEAIAQSEIKTAELINQIERQTIEQTLKNAEEGLEKELALEVDASEQRIKAFKKRSADFETEAKERQARINKAFGEGSQQALNTQETIGKQREALNKQVNDAIEAETQASLNRRSEIRKSFAEQEAQEARQELQKRIAELDKERQEIVRLAELEQLEIRQLRAEGQIDQQEADRRAFEARKKAIRDQIEELKAQEVALRVEDAFGAEVAQDEFNKIASARQRLNTELAELEEAQTSKLQEEEGKRGGIIAEGFRKAFQGIQKTLELVDGFASALNAREQQRLEGLAQERQARIDGLQEELSTASGLEKAFLQQRVNEEAKAAEAIAQAQERARKEQAIAQKAIAIGQAIINGALAVTAVLAQTTDPTPVQAFRAAAVAATIATTAAQVATIAAQPIAKLGGIEGEQFARGGMVYGRSHAAGGEKFAVGGRVVELEGGEAVINKRSTAMFRNQLSAMNVAGGGVSFQTGGVISPPMGAPTLAQAQQGSGEVLQLIATNQKTIQELKNAVMRQEVVYTTNTEDAIERDKQDRKEINARATL